VAEVDQGSYYPISGSSDLKTVMIKLKSIQKEILKSDFLIMRIHITKILCKYKASSKIIQGNLNYVVLRGNRDIHLEDLFKSIFNNLFHILSSKLNN